jgi:hypothetical protein
LQDSSDFNDNVNQGVRSSKNSQTQNQTSYATSSENAQNDKLEKDQSNTYLLLRSRFLENAGQNEPQPPQERLGSSSP